MRPIGVIAWSVVGLALPASERVGDAAGPVVAQERINLGVVGLDAQIGQDRVRSSGIVLDFDQGLVLTSAHSVWGARSLKIATALGVVHGRIVARAPCDDLALVETQPRIPGLASLEAADARAADAGRLLTAVGRVRTEVAAGAESLLAIPAHVAAAEARTRIDPKLPSLRSAIRLDGPLVPEASGGALVDRTGRLVAVAVATGAAGDAAAVPWPVVRQRLDELRVAPRRLYVGWHRHYRCAGALHAYARADHPGFRRRDARLYAPVPATRLPGTEGLDD